MTFFRIGNITPPQGTPTSIPLVEAAENSGYGLDPDS